MMKSSVKALESYIEAFERSDGLVGITSDGKEPAKMMQTLMDDEGEDESLVFSESASSGVDIQDLLSPTGSLKSFLEAEQAAEKEVEMECGNSQMLDLLNEFKKGLSLRGIQRNEPSAILKKPEPVVSSTSQEFENVLIVGDWLLKRRVDTDSFVFVNLKTGQTQHSIPKEELSRPQVEACKAACRAIGFPKHQEESEEEESIVRHVQVDEAAFYAKQRADLARREKENIANTYERCKMYLETLKQHLDENDGGDESNSTKNNVVLHAGLPSPLWK